MYFKNFYAVTFLIFSFYFFPLIIIGQDEVILPRLTSWKEDVYRLIAPNRFYLELKISTIKAEELKKEKWTITNKDLKEDLIYIVLEIRPLNDWDIDNIIHYDDLVNPCSKDKVGYFRFSKDDQEIILPIINENICAVKLCNNIKRTAKLAMKGNSKIPLWYYCKKFSVYYVLFVEELWVKELPTVKISVREEQLGDINPRPIWWLIPCEFGTGLN